MFNFSCNNLHLPSLKLYSKNSPLVMQHSLWTIREIERDFELKLNFQFIQNETNMTQAIQLKPFKSLKKKFNSGLKWLESSHFPAEPCTNWNKLEPILNCWESSDICFEILFCTKFTNVCQRSNFVRLQYEFHTGPLFIFPLWFLYLQLITLSNYKMSEKYLRNNLLVADTKGALGAVKKTTVRRKLPE